MDLACLGTFKPFWASLYKRSPLCFNAEYIGGICFCSPMNDFNTLSIYAVLVETSDEQVSMISPSLSPVEVLVPSIISARYVLSELIKNRDILVACPIQTGRSPVARGSKVPVCPTFLILNCFFIFCIACLMTALTVCLRAGFH